MATSANVYTLLKFYASRQKSPMIDYDEFSDYMKRYAQHHLDENADLVAFVGSSGDALAAELKKLVEQKQVVITNSTSTKKNIFVLSFFMEKYANTYREIETNIMIPFPNMNDLPKNAPNELVTKLPAAEVIYMLLDKQELNDKTLYGIQFLKDVPPVLLPSSIPVDLLINSALGKIREMLRKDEYHDYFLKKLSISNPGKEMTAKNFFNAFVQKPDEAFSALKESGDTFYFWSQLCYFIKQDYDKLKDFTAEDINVLQSVNITEVSTSYYKSKVMQKIQKDNALHYLDQLITHPPYFFSYAELRAMKDANGVPLLGQYSEENLKEHIQQLTTQASSSELPQLLIFKANDVDRNFILKDKVMPLIVRLCSDARVTVRANLSKVWEKNIIEFNTTPEMKEQPAFEKCLQRETAATQPILYALLNAPFLPLISYNEKNSEDSGGKLILYKEGSLIPYSEILMVSRQEIYDDAKLKLPFWYTMPFISWIMAFFMKKPSAKKGNRQEKTAAETVRKEEQAAEEEKERKRKMSEAGDEHQNRKQELRQAATDAEAVLVPSNSTLDRELYSYCHEWNTLIGKEANENLTEDVNSLIRDYMRKVLRTLKSTGFTPERIKSLAEALVDTPGMQKIKNHDALHMYTQLYMVKLVKNLP